ncbi:MAG: LysM peptidoglycan-binding domain-containing protein [Sinobacteraceae bacterium]|nr:LysM peptidoglycan-binding domain-containing protein [Nevskiaceae bacterium]MBV8852182.1 LysM peptidoglycan-binding domain-containing protein [Nevskiaceae bacterium]MBV9912558.1 LysM peptidoglycan-binding domain-containing protein [Nevskiaceae bacterium]
MVSNRIPTVRRCTGALTLLVALSGCSWLGHRADKPAVEPMASAAEVPDSGEAVPVDEMTATEAAVSKAGNAPAAAAQAPPADDRASILKPSAPKSYTVKRGDTLWGIASMFLRDPWLWPEVWYVNPQVANPHLIYPGDTLTLAYGKDGSPQIRLEQGGAARLDPRLRSSPLDGAIPTIPYTAIAAFLSRPSVLTNEQLRNAAHVVAFRDEHVVAGTGHEVYIADLKGQSNTRYSIVHVGDALRDPDDGKVVGYEGIYTATALVSSPGNPSKALLIDTARETLQGDKVLATDLDVPLNFMLRAPRNDVHGRIISVVDGTEVIGQYQIVVINRGKRHGIDAGHVLAIDQAGQTVHDIYAHESGFMHHLGGAGFSFAPKVKLPDEREGTLLVFKSYDRLSYALVIGASDAIRVNDVVHNP